MTNPPREQAANDDICAVLATLVGGDAAPCDLATLAAFRLDHAHHADRLPLLLHELAARQCAPRTLCASPRRNARSS